MPQARESLGKAGGARRKKPTCTTNGKDGLLGDVGAASIRPLSRRPGRPTQFAARRSDRGDFEAGELAPEDSAKVAATSVVATHPE